MAFFSDFWFCAAATTLTTGALMANIFIIFVCVYKECAIMRGKREAFDWFFFGLCFFFCEIIEISFLQLIKNLIMWHSEGAQILRYEGEARGARCGGTSLMTSSSRLTRLATHIQRYYSSYSGALFFLFCYFISNFYIFYCCCCCLRNQLSTSSRSKAISFSNLDEADEEDVFRMVTVLNSMRTSLARREMASELSLVKLMTFTVCRR